jgi:UDP-3-O-[3-hydroxymyristoyl] glucosamine N-acyltransferase
VRETKSISVRELVARIGGEIKGDPEIEVRGLAGLDVAGEGEMAYVEDERFFKQAALSNASCLIVPVGANGFKSPVVIEVANPRLAFALVAEILHPGKSRAPSIHETAVIADTADVALTAYIGPHVSIGDNTRIGVNTQLLSGTVIGDNVSIGDDCTLHPNAVLYDGVKIGDRVILHVGVSVGADGFGYVRDDIGYHKFPQIGTVVIEDDVELGAYTCVDRAALGVTRIGRGTKLDNLVHVGHNCDIGERVVIAAQTGISGSVVIEDDVVIGGQVGFGDHTRVQKGAVIGSKAGILPGKIVRPGVWWGIPVMPLDEYKKLNAHITRVPQMRAEIKELRRRLDELEKGNRE